MEETCLGRLTEPQASQRYSGTAGLIRLSCCDFAGTRQLPIPASCSPPQFWEPGDPEQRIQSPGSRSQEDSQHSILYALVVCALHLCGGGSPG